MEKVEIKIKTTGWLNAKRLLTLNIYAHGLDNLNQSIKVQYNH